MSFCLVHLPGYWLRKNKVISSFVNLTFLINADDNILDIFFEQSYLGDLISKNL